ncbi:recombinase family protein [Neobacillus mesonae]|nr:recombinase family protein [Neobacillus mesonae]
MLIGYMRPYEDDLQCEQQQAVLSEFSCDRMVAEEHASAKKRVELFEIIEKLQAGDGIVVAKLFALADSTRHLAELLEELTKKNCFLISASEGINTSDKAGYPFPDIVQHLLSFQSDVISEKTKKGLYEAKQKGMRPGRPRKPDENVKKAIVMYQSNEYTLSQIKEETGISKSTLYRYLDSEN